MPFSVTTPIYYVNSDPHLGHAYTTVAADVLARHHRQRGEEVFFLTGTDEHGAKVARAADEAGLTPKEFCDRVSARFRDLVAQLNATNDFFIRTTDPEHERRVQEFMVRLRDAGHLYEDSYAGLYCTGCEQFYAESDLEQPGNICPLHKTPVDWLEEENTFFRLSAFTEPLLELYDRDPEYVVPRTRYNEARSQIEAGLNDLSVSRASVSWGVPLPWKPDQTIYVWVDALLNYHTALEYGTGEDVAATFWPSTHLLGKDILRLHCVLWPALLMAAGYEPPAKLFVHGYLTSGDQKMSKSLGNVIDPLQVIADLGADALRFYVLREVQWGQDGSVTREALDRRYEGELANDLGNLVSRTTAMIARYRDGRVPAGTTALESVHERVGERFDAARPDRRAGGDLDARAGGEPLRRGPGPLGAREERRPGRRRAARHGALHAGRRRARPGRAPSSVHPRRLGADPRRNRRSRCDGLGQGRAGAHRIGHDGGAASAALPAPRAYRRVIDTHAHLEMCDGRPEDVVAAAAEAGVSRILTIGRDQAVALAGGFPGVWAVVGVHPHEAGDVADAAAVVRDLVGRPRVVAVGECGLDFYRDYAPRDAQRRAFAAQIEVANEAGLPLVIHTRAADDETFAMLEAAEVPVVLHCFGSVERLDDAIERGYLVSFAGNVAYPKAEDLREAARRVPDDRILAETDAPYLAPPPHRGRPNQPAYVMRTLDVLAAERVVDASVLEAQIDANATRVFGL